MFKILRLSFSNWDCWQPVSVPLDEPIVMLAGPNGSGKTTFLDGIRIILNASKLSTKRRRHKYMRDRRKMTVVLALVSNYEFTASAPSPASTSTRTWSRSLACSCRPRTASRAAT